MRNGDLPVATVMHQTCHSHAAVLPTGSEAHGIAGTATLMWHATRSQQIQAFNTMDSNVAITLSKPHQPAAQLQVDELTAVALEVATNQSSCYGHCSLQTQQLSRQQHHSHPLAANGSTCLVP